MGVGTCTNAAGTGAPVSCNNGIRYLSRLQKLWREMLMQLFASLTDISDIIVPKGLASLQQIDGSS